MEDKKRKLKEQFTTPDSKKSGNSYVHGSHSDMIKKFAPNSGYAAYNGKYNSGAPKSTSGGCKSCGGGR